MNRASKVKFITACKEMGFDRSDLIVVGIGFDSNGPLGPNICHMPTNITAESSFYNDEDDLTDPNNEGKNLILCLKMIKCALLEIDYGDKKDV